ncbi:MAG: hypothetical protein AAF957_01175 [Planctomycetota bacterium]
MLALTLVLPSLLALDLIVFDNGDYNVVTAADVQPTDDLLVRLGPGGLFDTTIVDLRDGAIVRDVTLENGSYLRAQLGAEVTRNVVVQGGGSIEFLEASTASGHIRVEAGGLAVVTRADSVGSIDVLPDGELEVLGETTVTGDVDLAGNVAFRRAILQGNVTLRASANALIADSTIAGLALVEGSSDRAFNGVEFQSGVTLRDATSASFGLGTTFTGALTLEDTSSASIRLATSNLGFGDVAGTSGVAVGTDRYGRQVSFAFFRDAGATLTIVEDAPLGVPFCGQAVPNQAGLFGRIQAYGSPVLSQDNLFLEAADLPPNTFSFFFVGTDRDSVPFLLNTICTGGNRGRYVGPGQIRPGNAAGRAELRISTSSIPGNPATTPSPGDTYVFQCWHRAHNPATTSNFTDAIEVTFE